MNWEEGKKGFENYLKLEKSLSQNSVAAYVNDISKLISFLERNYSKVTPLKVKLINIF
ncbi:MAG: integrase/recombinase [Prolixibacteraceae bacterium]|nr:MAG: integrase/recombinase [Prolixibacteraceae bacterium]